MSNSSLSPAVLTVLREELLRKGELNLEGDWLLLFIQQYTRSLFISPLLAVETLTQIQYQPKDTAEDLSEKSETSAPRFPLLTEGIPDTLRLIVDSEIEGWRFLLKGHITQFIWQSSFSVLQPAVEEALNDFFNVIEDIHPVTMVLSNAVAGCALAPIELIRTRLICQSRILNRSYMGPVDGLIVSYRNERENTSSSILSTFYSARLMIPTALVYTVGPIVRYLCFQFVQHELGLDSYFSPILYKLTTLGILGLETLVTTPIEMARKRLFVQSLSSNTFTESGSADPVRFKATVRTSPYWCPGLGTCLYTIVKHEGGRRRIRELREQQATSFADPEWADMFGGGVRSSSLKLQGHQKKKYSNGLLGKVHECVDGVSTLYRGFLPRYLATVLNYVSQEIVREDFFV